MVNAIITPRGDLDVLSRSEIASLQDSSESIYRELFRNCALAVLSTGADSDDGHALLAAHADFEIELISAARGVKLKVTNAPANAFVGDEIIAGIRSHLFAVLRDIVFLQDQVEIWHKNGDSITGMVFKTLRHAKALKPRRRPNLIVCWGGHSINKIEYDYSKEVGYRLGLRSLDICTGCGIGAMKGPMKEEILYILGVLLNQKNKHIHVPLIFTGPKESKAYFEQMDKFIGDSIGAEAQKLYTIIVDDPIAVATQMTNSMEQVYSNRRELDDAFFYNWSLTIEEPFQQAFDPSHENMAALKLRKDQDPAKLAADLRRAFSGIVAGNVKPNGIEAIKKHGVYKIDGDPELMSSLDVLLSSFVDQRRMKLSGDYTPCYELISLKE